MCLWSGSRKFALSQNCAEGLSRFKPWQGAHRYSISLFPQRRRSPRLEQIHERQDVRQWPGNQASRPPGKAEVPVIQEHLPVSWDDLIFSEALISRPATRSGLGRDLSFRLVDNHPLAGCGMVLCESFSFAWKEIAVILMTALPWLRNRSIQKYHTIASRDLKGISSGVRQDSTGNHSIAGNKAK